MENWSEKNWVIRYKKRREKLLEQKRKNKNEIITAENEDMNYNYIFANDEKICFYQQVILL